MVRIRGEASKKESGEESFRGLISAVIGKLSIISNFVDDAINILPKLKNAAIPNVRYYHIVFQPNPIVSWDQYRNTRREAINKALIDRSFHDFPLAEIELKEAGSFKIIKDDCDDMMTVLRVFLNYNETLTFLLLKNIFERQTEIVSRYYYMVGYHGMKYEIGKRYIAGPGAASAQSGRWTLETAEKVLSRYGGIDVYDKLPHGKKGPVRADIAKAIKDPDGRNVYNILRKLRNRN